MKKYIILFMLASSVFYGCDALGIKQADNSSDDISENTGKSTPSSSFDNQISESKGRQSQSNEILQLQKEIDELISTINAKDVALTEFENKIKLLEEEKRQIAAKSATVTAELVDLKGDISTNKQYRNIAIIIAVISVFFNALLAYLYIRTRARNKRAALPPGKEDMQNGGAAADTDINTNVDVETKQENTEIIPVQDNGSALSENENESEINTVENNEDKKVAKKRGRPRKTDKSDNSNNKSDVIKPASKRGRPRKVKPE